MPEENKELPIHNMDDRHYGLTQWLAGNYLEAARVCLDRHHVTPVTFRIREAPQNGLVADVRWEQADDRAKAAWRNDDDATRDGAYCCVIAAVELISGLTAVARAETKTGADYYMASPGTSVDDLEDHIRLEISGVDHGNDTEVRYRLKAKLDQARRGHSDLPAMAGVIGFRTQLIPFQLDEAA